jgi:hypothetical protein
MIGIAVRQRMKSPVVLVTLALAAAILVVAAFLVATGTRGDDAIRPVAAKPPLSPAVK